MEISPKQRETSEQMMTHTNPVHIEQLIAENQQLRNMVIEKELELDALHQRLNCIIDGFNTNDTNGTRISPKQNRKEGQPFRPVLITTSER